ncbi:MAG: CAP domain-containing protein [Ilumatobacteraceae bacterium]|nr:CAP domain-containing protein [Ilumatobacteraceae bacterium]
MRAPGLVIVVTALAVGSVAAASATAIVAPAEVGREAYRVAPPFRPDQTSVERAVDAVIELVNDERARRGLPVMRPHELVTAAAMAHAADMADRRAMVHVGADGSDTGERLDRAGFVWRSWGEAIGGGYGTPEPLFDAWMASDEHRPHIIGEHFYLGVGVATTSDGVPYWVLVVAS